MEPYDSRRCWYHGTLAVLCGLSALIAPYQASGASPVQSPLERSVHIERVIIVFKTHFDIGYTDMAVNVVQRYRTEMIDKALGLVDETRNLPRERQFVWTLPGWPMETILEDWPGQQPERKQRLRAAFMDGRFVVHALPFTTHTELLEPEDLVRGLHHASRLCREMNLPLPRDAKMTDVPSHSWILPTLLKAAGVEFLHLGCNAASSSPDVPLLFWWQGPDGSRLLTMYSASGYGSSHLPPAGWPHRTWLALMHTGDNHGPPTPDEVNRLLLQIEKDLPGARIDIGRLSDFSDAILSEKPDLPVLRADMPDTWIHGPMSDPIGAKIARNIRPAMASVAALHTSLQSWGVAVPDASATIAGAYENSLLYGEHTWGGALAWLTPYQGEVKFDYGDTWRQQREDGRFKRQEESWREHTAYIEKTADVIQPLLHADMQALASAVDAQSGRIVVYNPLPWVRDGYVSIPVGSKPISAVKPVSQGEILPVETRDGTVGFIARDVPAMGYQTYLPVEGQTPPGRLVADEAHATLEGPFFRLVVDAQKGTIRSLVDKGTGRELVDTAAPQGFGQFLYERFDASQVKAFQAAYTKLDTDWARCEFGKPNLPDADVAPYLAASPEGFTVRYERTSVAVRAIMDSKPGGAVPCGLTTTLTLYDQLPYLDLEMTLHDKQADPWPEAGWICFPFKLNPPRFQLSRLGAIVDPIRDTTAGANHYLYGLNGGVAVLDPQGCTAGLCAIDHPLVSLDAPGSWKYSKEHTPTRSRVYINLFNNQWTTNFRFWNEGTWSSRVRLWASGKYEASTSLIVPSVEARYPLLAAWTDAKPGPLPVTRQGIRVCRAGVLLTAFGPNSDGDGTILRLWEQAGWSGKCRVELPQELQVESVEVVNLRGERTGDSIPVRGHAIEVDLKAFAPVTLLLAGGQSR